jgi:hypothetical protein
MFRFVLLEQLLGLCSGRTLDRLDVACGAHGSLDKGWSAVRANDRARGVCAYEPSNVVALDLA